MRYFCFLLKTTSENIKAKTTKIRLRDYDFESVLGAVNSYLYRNLGNDVCFIAYRDEANAIPAVFSFNDRNDAFDDVFAQITETLSDIFSVNKYSAPYEITTFHFYDCYQEARRRGLVSTFSGRIIETARLDYYNNVKYEAEQRKYLLSEKIISDKPVKSTLLYDDSVKAELENIEAHQNTSGLSGNMAHYFISGKSCRACVDIAQAVGQRLFKANRLKSRRMEIITEIAPTLHNSSCYFEDLIENNSGGAVVIDLSERQGCSHTDYEATRNFLEKIFKTYKNDCVFMFTYNTDAPGFSYELLRSIVKYILPVRLKEGVGDRKAAVKFLKELIKASEYSEYAEQAGEFLKLFPENEFSRTDIFEAFDRFG